MALLVLSGQPCSGKSNVAAALKQLLSAKGLEVIIIDEPSLSLKRNNSYKGKSFLRLFTCASSVSFVLRWAEWAEAESSCSCGTQTRSARRIPGAA